MAGIGSLSLRAYCSCELQQELLITSAGFDLPSALLRPQRFSANFGMVADPAVTQYLTVTRAQLTYPICYVFAVFQPYSLSESEGSCSLF